MQHKDYKSICEQCLPLIYRVGDYLKSNIDEVTTEDVKIKGRNSLVSYVDEQAERMLTAGLRPLLPEATFITEEQTIKQEKSEYTWIVDPLDGTSNYLQKIPHYSISVALAYQDQIVIGIVLQAHTSECFYAIKDYGAFLDGNPIVVSDTEVLDQTVIATGFPYQRSDIAPLIRTLGHFMRYGRGIRRMGSAALDLAYVACGRYDAYYETTLNVWDVAAGALIVKEAGGRVSDFKGSDQYIYGKQIIAANPIIYTSILEIIKSKFI